MDVLNIVAGTLGVLFGAAVFGGLIGFIIYMIFSD